MDNRNEALFGKNRKRVRERERERERKKLRRRDPKIRHN
jgi:hypothetical protein